MDFTFFQRKQRKPKRVATTDGILLPDIPPTDTIVSRSVPSASEKLSPANRAALPESKKKLAWQMPLMSGRLSTKDQSLFAKRLSFLIKAGVPVLESLHVLRKQTESRRAGRVLDRVIQDVANGRFLSGALDRYRRHFGEFAINIIRVGESSGVLSQNLHYLAEELEKKEALRKKVISALVYPIFITLATLGVTSMLTVYIFPKVLPIFNSLSVELPLTTRILIGVSDFLKAYGLPLLGVVLAVSIALVVLHRNVKQFRIVSDRVFIHLPLSGLIMRNYNMANICRTLGLMLKSGVMVVDALETTAETTRNRVYRAHLRHAAEHVKRGEQISQHFQKHSVLFPVVMSHMIAIGERTGNLSDTLVYLSELYEGEVDSLTKNLSSAIEPVLMILMGLLVGFVAVSVITPIYEITQNLSNQIR
ncbi:type II secretion system F family protein [Candidatus Wolfebacteria bacterium]|nr:type II secretion system F family protein [Candidatus Wolfebacteria bacterium]